MDVADFDYSLPPALIAQHPAAERSASRLLVLDGASSDLVDARFRDLPRFLRPIDLLVLNDTRVIPARLYGRKVSGGRVEIMIERITGANTALAHLRANRTPAPGAVLLVEGGGELRATGRRESLFELRSREPLTEILARCGRMPLPPYIGRADRPEDRARYQTVYARQPGAVAAPTAGLHFTPELMAALAETGVETAALTLHVGAGTFLPVKADDARDHPMHAETGIVTEATADAVNRTRAAGGRVLAVGTTALRLLESAVDGDGRLTPFTGETDIFILPGFRFRITDLLLTNFHLPRSTLFMLVCAFAGTDRMKAAYAHAVAAGYRFYSYGDACLLERAS